MEQELSRLATFVHWPESCPARPQKLARLGFFRQGIGDEVECVSCHIRLCGWRADDSVEDRHRAQSPNCEYLCGHDFESRLPRLPAVNSDSADVAADGLRTTCPENREPIGIKGVYADVLRRANSKNLFSLENHTLGKPDYVNLRFEENRFQTFWNFPLGASIDPRAFARDGLFYTGSGNLVECAFCHNAIGNWEPANAPADVHRRRYPDCPFVRGDDVGNVPLPVPADRIDNSRAIANGDGSVVANQNATSAIPSIQRESILQRNLSSVPPKFPEYLDVARRVQSFRYGQVARGHTAENFAEAGFFYAGPGDRVQCFQCGGVLRDWEPDDDPFDEHRRWYDHCPYAKLNRRTSSATRPLEGSRPMLMPSAASYRIEPREVKARLDTNRVRAVLEMGMSRDTVKLAIENQLSATGDDFSNVQDLLEAVFELEHAGANLPACAATATSGSETAGLPPSLLNESSAPASAIPAAAMASAAIESAAATSLGGTDLLPKSKGKKKRNKRKKPQSAGHVLTNEEESQEHSQVPSQDPGPSQVPGPSHDPGQDSGAVVNSDEEPNLRESNLLEVMDSETRQYVEENQRLREARMCKVCMDMEFDTVFLPCGHLVCCSNCAPQLRNCPICRIYIRGTVKTFLS